MKKRLLKRGIVVLIALAIIIIFLNFFLPAPYWTSSIKEKGQPILNNYNVDMEILPDGSAYITERHELEFEKRDREYFNYFKLFSSGNNVVVDRDTFTEVSVSVDGKQLSRAQFNDYDVMPWQSGFDRDAHRNEWYLVYNNESAPAGYEIGVVLDDFIEGDRVIDISYRFNNLVKLASSLDQSSGYVSDENTVAVLDWMFVAENNGVPIRNMTATVTFPESGEDKLYTWLHMYDGVGEAEIVSNICTKYTVENVHAENFIETRLTMDPDLFYSLDKYTVYSDNDKHYTSDLSGILEQEKDWYDESIALDKKLLRSMYIDIAVAIVLILLSVGLVVALNIKRRPPHIDNAPEYIRDLPQDWTVEEAMPLYNHYNADDWTANCVSATVMNLIRREFITVTMPNGRGEAKLQLKTFERPVTDVIKDDDSVENAADDFEELTGIAGNDNVAKTAIENNDAADAHEIDEIFGDKEENGASTSDISARSNGLDSLSPYERTIYDMLYAFAEDKPFSMNEFEKWSKAHPAYIDLQLKEYKKDADKKTVSVRPKRLRNLSFIIMMAGLMFAAVFSFLSVFINTTIMWATGHAIVLAIGIYYMFYDFRQRPLTKQGQEQYLHFKALGKYMLDFGSFEDKDIPELKLWEEYMVWATGMGIADKVSQQLSIKYPQYAESMSADSAIDTFVFWYLFSPGLRTTLSLNISGCFNSVNSSISAYNMQKNIARVASSIGGSGGGRGGGGFRGGGGGAGGGMGAR